MPTKATAERAKEDLRQGKSPSTAAGEFVREEIEHVRSGKHGARSPEQVIAIGLDKARRAGIPLSPPAPGATKRTRRRSAEQAYREGQAGAAKPTPKYSRIREEVLGREPRSAASRQALSRQAHSAARRKPRTQKQSVRRTAKTRRAA